MNLLDYFVLQHAQFSLLHSELLRTVPESGVREAKVEMNLTPRPIETDGDLPAYQVSARLTCKGGNEEESDKGAFVVQVGLEAVYQQISGDPLDLNQFSEHHPTLTRQLYPLLQQELRFMMARLGLEQIRLPFDLTPIEKQIDEPTIEVSSSLH